MRPRSVVLVLVGLTILACTGTADVASPDAPAADQPARDDAEPSPAPAEPRRKKKRPGEGGEHDDGGDEPGSAPSPGPSPAPAPNPSPPQPAPSAPAGIEQVDATTWRVDKKLKNQWVSSPNKLGASARAKGKGYELSKITQSDDAWHLGFRNGDIVKEVNGYSLASEAEAIAAYAALKNAKKVTAKIKRGDGPIHHTYLVE